MLKPFTMVLADDHQLVREGMRHTINADPGLKVVGEAGNGLELMELLKKNMPDMVVLDISMPGLR